jgi:peptide/nickel transport system substrate-binding protein
MKALGTTRWRRTPTPLLPATVALAAGLVVACAPPAKHTPLVVAFGESRCRLDPHLGNRAVGWSVLSSFYDPLVAFSERLELRPALAESWSRQDATHWRFELRHGVQFQDGRPLTPADVVASLERARNHPRSALRHYLLGVSSVRADGDHAVVIETAAPVPDLLARLTFVLVVPKEQARRDEITAPVGTGPYRFLGIEAGGAVVAQAWSGWRGRPEIEDVRFEFDESDEAAARRLVDGSVDVCHLLPEDWVAEVAAARQLRVVEQPRLAVQLLGFHPELAPQEAARALADPRVRRALLLALDRQDWVRRLYRGNGMVASQYVHPAVFGFDPAVEPVPFDPDAARRLLAEAGFSGGLDLSLGFRPAGLDVATAIADDLGKIGVRVHLAPGLKARELVAFSWACSTGDASDFLNNIIWRPDAAGPEADHSIHPDGAIAALLRQADEESDRGRRLELLQEAQRRSLESLPLLPLTIRLGYKGVSSRVEVVPRYDERECIASYRWRE